MTNSPQRATYRFRVPMIVLSLILLPALPVTAGGRGGKTKLDSTTSSSTIETTETSASYDGSLEPTNVAIVSSDLTFSVDTSVESLLQTDLAHTVATGKGVTVAVLDGGFTRADDNLMHALSGNWYDAVDGDSDPFDPGNGVDDDRDGIVDNARGHGTFVMGMINKVAPDARILPIRVADDEGNIREQWLYDGIVHAKNAGVDVINLSLEMALLSDTTAKMLYYAAKESGILIVVSAGNDASDGAMGALAESQMTIAVGAVNDQQTIADFSNYESHMRWGDALVYAPGVDLKGPCGFPYKDSTCVWSGTSFATGLVSGAVALGLEHTGGLAGLVYYGVLGAIDPVFTADGKQLALTGQINLLKLLGIYETTTEQTTDPTTETTKPTSESSTETTTSTKKGRSR